MTTPRQQDLLAFIKTYLKAYGIAPSYDQCGQAIGLIARSAVAREIIALERAGLIRRIPSYNNAIELLPSADNHVPHCHCKRCAAERYARDLKIVQAINNYPPVHICMRLSGLRPVVWEDRAQPAGAIA